MRALSIVGLLAVLGSTPGVLPTFAQSDDQSSDPRLFAATGFRIDNDDFWSFFQGHGGQPTFGNPISSTFQFMSCPSQFFEMGVMQECPGQGVGMLTIMSSQFLPYARISGSTLPAADPSVTSQTPPVSDPSYADDMTAFIQSTVHDTFNGQPVSFDQTFFGTVTSDVAGTTDPDTLTLLNLDVWGAPTSNPFTDPANSNFIYQRFERGVMKFDATSGTTAGLPVGTYLAEIITGQNLPDDLRAEAASSPLYQSATAGKNAPQGTLYGQAFTPGAPPPPLPGQAGPVPSATPTSTPRPAAASAYPVATVPSPDYGLSMFLWGHPTTTSRDLGLATAAGFHWQKTLFQWKDNEPSPGTFNWTEADRVVKATNAAGISIVARLDEAPGWAAPTCGTDCQAPPTNDQDYWNYVSALVSRYKKGSPNGTIAAIEIWNEPNINREWGNTGISTSQAGDYIKLLTGAYQAAKAADPNVIVLTAGLSPTGVRTTDAMDDVQYLTWLYNAGLQGGVNYDALGAHGNTQAPCVACDFNSLPAFQDPSFYFRRIEQLRAVQVQNGDQNRQIWLLEFGWTSDSVHSAYSWFAVSEQQKATNIVQAFQYARANWSPWIGVMTVWTMADAFWTPDREEYWWAITNPDGSPRPAYTAIQAARSNGTLP